MRRAPLFLLLVPALAVSAGAGSALQRPLPEGMVRIEGGSYRPLYVQPGETQVQVESFLLDARPVTRGEYEQFLVRHSRWQRGAVPGLFADDGYLRDWESPTSAGETVPKDAPVTHVSWFAARSYCAARGGRLPTTAEWEYVALADERRRDASEADGFLKRVLELTLQRGATRAGAGFRNVWGVYAMHGGVMEWVSDFQSVFAGSDSRVGERREGQLTCAGGATATGDARDYAAFLRYAWRATVDARTTTGSLGFRCAGDLQ
ncbi:MAG TPA: formylglycine-generating enzyme family protein [Longimicrobiales bacterium]|nr:formylglycine-generating enzyme family protein [Longimicrobiales bacterium]